jgi:hypothetical protein
MIGTHPTASKEFLMTDPYRIALATVRLFAITSLVSGAMLALLCVLVTAALLNTALREAIPYILSIMMYAIIYTASGFAEWIFARPMARFVAKAFAASEPGG